MDSRELVWRYAMDEAQRLTGDKSGDYKLPMFGKTFSATITDNGSSGTSYSIRDRGRFKLSGWRVNGTLESFMPDIHAQGFSSVYEKYAAMLRK